MENLKVAELIEALNFVGRVIRSKDGSKPAELVIKLIKELDRGSDLTLAEWAEVRRSPSKSAKKSKAIVDEDKIGDVVLALDQVQTQNALRAEIARLKLSAPEWRKLATKLAGKAGASGKEAREIVETHFSNRLLLQGRVDSVKRLFG